LIVAASADPVTRLVVATIALASPAIIRALYPIASTLKPWPAPGDHGSACEQNENSPAMDQGSARPRQRSVEIKTIGDLGERERLYAYCDVCRHSGQLDLVALRERYGTQLSLDSLRDRLRCSRCGARIAQAFHVWKV
jgi:hypothetical protein